MVHLLPSRLRRVDSDLVRVVSEVEGNDELGALGEGGEGVEEGRAVCRSVDDSRLMERKEEMTPCEQRGESGRRREGLTGERSRWMETLAVAS